MGTLKGRLKGGSGCEQLQQQQQPQQTATVTATTTTTKKKQQQQLSNQIGLNCGHKMMNNVSQSLAQFQGIVGRTPTSVPL